MREAELVGVREFPRNVRGADAVYSGLLIFGLSACASVVTLAAARQFGDTDVVDALDREAELLGPPSSWGGERRYALGVLPIGDAFLAWARSRPEATTPAISNRRGVLPLWPVFVGIAVLPALAAGLLLALRRLRQAGRSSR